MLSGKQLILATKPFAKEIRWKSWFFTLYSFALLIAAIVASVYVDNIALKIVLSIFIAMMLSRVFIIFHDYQHHTILQKSILANILFTTFGVYMISPPSIWKRSHDFHHNHNAKLYSASIGSYPIMTKKQFLEASDADRFYYLSVRSPINMFFAYFTTFMYGMCIQSFLSSPRRHWDSLVILISHIAIGTLFVVYFGWITFFLSFFLPFFLSHMLGAYLFYAQHNFPEATFNDKENWNYAEAAIHSSSFMKLNPFMNWVTANIGYHHIHHLNARIPYYRLPEAMAALPELQNPKITTLKLSDIKKCLHLKVWDPELNKMIGFDQLEGYTR
jgi:acyl-lipid omega-6 desaturase (Delta-12 desaturase)